jgi:predicted acyl esterase
VGRIVVRRLSIFLLPGVVFLALAVGAEAKSRPTPLERAATSLGLSCAKTTSADKVAYLKCTGKIASFDGIGLDTDLSIPLTAKTARPTIVMLHGWSQDKTTWEATSKAGNGAGTWHWNNVWFVSHGWVVVNYTARGFQQSCGTTDQGANCTPNGYTHLSDRRFETRDTQTLLGKLVDAGIAKAKALASTGDSYGGGQTWLLATSLPWKSPKGKTLRLAAGVPLYGWTDLLDSLAPNGRATALPDQSQPHGVPLGVPKASYISGLYAVGRAQANGRYDESPADYGTNLDEGYARIQAGEPYDPSTDPVLKGIVDAYQYRSAYDATAFLAKLAAKKVKPVPVFSVQGWTDPLFPAVQTLQMFQKLRGADRHYPIQMAFADVGHSNAQNPAWQWKPILRLTNAFLTAHVLGRTHAAPKQQAYSFQTECGGTATPAPASGTWSSLSNHATTLTSSTAGTTASATGNPADGADSDPIANAGCLHETSGTTDPGAVYYTFANASPTHLLGLPQVTLTYALTGTDAVVGLKLWDQAPDGSKTLVTRGAYRVTTSGSLTTYLYGNDWVFPAGDSIVLQVTQNDSPYLRPDNEPSSIAWSALKLVLPTRT